MKNCKKHFIVALIVLMMGQLFTPNKASSQIIEVGGSVGLSYYMGDINPKIPFVQSKLGWGALVRYYDGTRWAFRLAYSNLQLECNDKATGYRPERGLSFKNNVHDISLIAEFNFLDYFTGSKRNGLSPYIFGGISVLFFDVKNADGISLHDKMTDVESYQINKDSDVVNNVPNKSKTSVSIPFGIGVKYSLSRKLGVAMEWRWHYTFTDWLDDCHGYYPTYKKGDDVAQYSDPTGFAADDEENNDYPYIQRGNSEDNDWYGYLNVSMVYKFNLPKGKDCNKRERYKNYD